MSLTDPINSNDEKEAIEAEHMLAAEREASVYMEDYLMGVQNRRNRGVHQWRGIVEDEAGCLVTLSKWCDTRKEAISDAEKLFDVMQDLEAHEIYGRAYESRG